MLFQLDEAISQIYLPSVNAVPGNVSEYLFAPDFLLHHGKLMVDVIKCDVLRMFFYFALGPMHEDFLLGSRIPEDEVGHKVHIVPEQDAHELSLPLVLEVLELLDGQHPLHVLEFEVVDDPKLGAMVGDAYLRTVVGFQKRDEPEHRHLFHRIDEQVCCFDDSVDNIFNDFLLRCELLHIDQFFVLEFPVFQIQTIALMQIFHKVGIVENSQSPIEFINLPKQPMLSPVQSESIHLKHYPVGVKGELGVFAIEQDDKLPVREYHKAAQPTDLPHLLISVD